MNITKSIDYLPDNSEVERVVTTGNHMAYLKIAEGCDSDAAIVSFQRSADVQKCSNARTVE